MAGAGGTRRGRAESDTKRDFSGKEDAARGEGKKGRDEEERKEEETKTRKTTNNFIIGDDGRRTF